MNLVQSLAETARKKGEKPAYIFMDQSVSYDQLNKMVTKFSSSLANMGIGKGDNVALIVGNSPHFLIGLYGTMKAGATVIPINPIYTADEMHYILQNGDVKTIITLDILLPVIQSLTTRIPSLEHIIICETSSELNHTETEKMKTFTDFVASGDLSFEGPELDEEDVAVILYTSGTTGKPKGAMLTHKNLYSNAGDVAAYLQYTGEDRIVAALPMFHVFCLTVAVNAPIVNGATILMLPKFSPKEVFRICRTYEPTIFAGVPTMYNYLYLYEDAGAEDVHTLRLCISGGASMPVALLKNFEKRFGVIVSEGYGLSEASPVTCFNPLDRPRKPGSIGTNIWHVENKIVNELGEEVPIGEVGELIVRGPNVMKGYYKAPEDTAATLRDGWLYTGDLARADEEGYFYIVDRKKDIVLVGGYNVYPREVEEVLYQHDAVAEVVVIGVPDERLGEAVRAYVVLNHTTVTEAELVRYCSLHLAKYKVPKSIEFLEELPKNTTGKLLRRALKEKAMQS
ncbi:fatty acid--CoA ligase family protein [Bacillus sp. DX1.1]|uniref:fatty acid--CoA ligase family protein n=1 Tax=unclassified Bacillus (in: firmicutes) TaxID=185979 RepID=UPI002570A16C|nr:MULTISPECIES: fatty acid--CoA ligase family protein [unclassified Bacillus (in: firmicutes)]MDM5153770.1 fatty acid--CoA ligase family protein [Bacillus sp. DX1.1]WJE82707.1 fatty acid--CoA ligase family protein [Bacillus sp. DX3.1]